MTTSASGWAGYAPAAALFLSIKRAHTTLPSHECPPDCTTPSHLQVCCLVLNASLFADPSMALEEYEEQRAWFVQELQAFSRGTLDRHRPMETSRPT